jgi:hypothetical protein
MCRRDEVPDEFHWKGTEHQLRWNTQNTNDCKNEYFARSGGRFGFGGVSINEAGLLKHRRDAVHMWSLGIRNCQKANCKTRRNSKQQNTSILQTEKKGTNPQRVCQAALDHAAA